jgi:hypothetical protein
MGLRIYHNGDVRNGNPHWHLWFQQNGSVWGEVLCYHTAREVKEQLTESEAKTMFEAADAMSQKFPDSGRLLETDDVCIKRTEQGKTLYWYKVSPDEQKDELAIGFIVILKRLVEKYKPTS